MRQRACVDATAHPSGGYAVELALEESAQATALLAQLLEDRVVHKVLTIEQAVGLEGPRRGRPLAAGPQLQRVGAAREEREDEEEPGQHGFSC